MSKKPNRKPILTTNKHPAPAADSEVTKDLKKPQETSDSGSCDVAADLESQIDDAISRGDWAEVTRLRYENQPRPKKAGDPMLPPSKQ